MTAVEAFLRDQFAGDPAVHRPEPGGRRFGGRGLRLGETVFAMSWHGALAVRLPAPRVAELVATSAGEPLRMGERVMKAWLVIDDPALWRALAREARDALGPGPVSTA